MAQLMPLPLTVSCFSKIQIGFTFLVPAHLGSPRKRAVKRVCVCVVVKISLQLNQRNDVTFHWIIVFVNRFSEFVGFYKSCSSGQKGSWLTKNHCLS